MRLGVRAQVWRQVTAFDKVARSGRCRLLDVTQTRVTNKRMKNGLQNTVSRQHIYKTGECPGKLSRRTNRCFRFERLFPIQI